jgi:3-oxoacyl-[acyl-carrier protein] reductase
MSDPFDVRQEVILVTGASQGLGRQFARVLAAHGAAVVLAARQADKLKSLEDEIRSQGGRAAAVAMDITDTASIAGAMTAAEAALGPISVLINNAGIAIEKPAVDQAEADWDAVLNANLKGAYFAATELSRRMIARQQEGNIVNIASDRRRIRSRRRHPALGLQGLALHDRQRGDGGWRVPADVRGGVASGGVQYVC